MKAFGAEVPMERKEGRERALPETYRAVSVRRGEPLGSGSVPSRTG